MSFSNVRQSKTRIVTVLIAAAIIMTTTVAGVCFLHPKDQGKPTSREDCLYKASPGQTMKIDELDLPRAFYFTNDQTMVSVRKGGLVTPHQTGRAELTALTMDGRKSKVYLRIAMAQHITADKREIKATYKGPRQKITAKTDATEGNLLTYAVEDEKVAEVDGKGNIIFKNAGETNLVITAAESQDFHGAKKVIPITVGKKAAELKVAKASLSFSMLDTKQKIEASSNSKGKLTYTVDNKDLAEVDKDGNIKPLSDGQTIVHIKQKATKNFTGAEAQVTLDITRPTAADKALAAVGWAREIAADDSFAYGTGDRAHRSGCYFCGTTVSGKKHATPGDRWERTYCCNPFVFAAYAHGAQIPSVLKSCQNGGCGGMDPGDWTPHGFACLGHADELRYEDLLPGDVIISDSPNHVWMVAGDGEYVEAGYEGWGADTIAVRGNCEKNFHRYQNATDCYVMRYVEEGQ